MRNVIALLAGLVFGIGLVLSQMVNPEKVRGFLDLFGNFDPSLAFVLGGAVGVSFLAWRMRGGRRLPILGGAFPNSLSGAIDRDLVFGSLLFGFGWGLGGLCPGPAIAGILMMNKMVWLFVAAMIGGMLIANIFEKSR